MGGKGGGESFGYFKSTANFPGPKYGLPGYKESHKWETGAFNPSPTLSRCRIAWHLSLSPLWGFAPAP